MITAAPSSAGPVSMTATEWVRRAGDSISCILRSARGQDTIFCECVDEASLIAGEAGIDFLGTVRRALAYPLRVAQQRLGHRIRLHRVSRLRSGRRLTAC